MITWTPAWELVDDFFRKFSPFNSYIEGNKHHQDKPNKNKGFSRGEARRNGGGTGAKVIKVEKLTKVEKEKWKTFKVPESLWRLVKTAAAKKGVKIYQELEQKYED